MKSIYFFLQKHSKIKYKTLNKITLTWLLHKVESTDNTLPTLTDALKRDGVWLHGQLMIPFEGIYEGRKLAPTILQCY